eukprot:COSAG04_NODE_3997_length_2370_cov_89.698258_1_plen_103_part_10
MHHPAILAAAAEQILEFTGTRMSRGFPLTDDSGGAGSSLFWSTPHFVDDHAEECGRLFAVYTAQIRGAPLPGESSGPARLRRRLGPAAQWAAAIFRIHLHVDR